MGHHIYMERAVPLSVPRAELLAGAARKMALYAALYPKHDEPGFFKVPGISIKWYKAKERKDTRGPHYEPHGMDTVSDFGTSYLRGGVDEYDDDGVLPTTRDAGEVAYRLGITMVETSWDRALYARARRHWFTMPLETYTRSGKPRGRRNFTYVVVQKLQFNIRVPMSWGDVDINSKEKLLAFLQRLEDAYSVNGVPDERYNVDNLRWLVDLFDEDTVAYIS